MTVTNGGAALSAVGQPPLLNWPYNDRLGVGTEDAPASVGRPPWHTGVVHELRLANDGVEEDLEDLLAAGTPIILLVEVTDEFNNPDDDGYVDLPNVRVPAGDYHAVVCVGAATRPIRGRCLLIRNSWGDYWGLGGYCWLPLAYLVAFVPVAATVQSTST
jgi:hypothetical protein